MTRSCFVAKTRSVVCAVVLALAISPALAGPPAGSIVVTERRMNPALRSFQEDLKTEATKVLTKKPEHENWKIFFIAYLKKAAGDSKVNVVFYDAGQSLKPGQPREPLHFAEIGTKPDTKVLMSDLELRPDQGFKEGGKYQVLITRLINGKEEVFARTLVDLK
ncbi:MAG: hypothetical protein KA258_04415 [Deltaproteobacteria bacterium]|jgi:hypothetical protein|nr:hypothetical protein [Deltaproteobacteria bacterium]MBP8195779.1 hypothetical protein [Deltaproteobacteria bacterium]